MTVEFFARGKPRLNGLTFGKTFERQVAARKASKERAAESRLRHQACFKVMVVFDSIVPSTYQHEKIDLKYS